MEIQKIIKKNIKLYKLLSIIIFFSELKEKCSFDLFKIGYSVIITLYITFFLNDINYFIIGICELCIINLLGTGDYIH